MKRAVYTGTFDPVHLGHLDMIGRASTLVDELIVGVGINMDKSTFFSLDERVELLREVCRRHGNVRVEPFNGLAVRFVRQVGGAHDDPRLTHALGHGIRVHDVADEPEP